MVLKVISLNLWCGGKLMQPMLEFLAREDADVVMLQEVYDGRDPALPENYRSMEVLAAELKYPYADFGQAYFEDWSGNKIPHGNAILSKFEISRSKVSRMADDTLESYMDIPQHWPILPAPLQYVCLETPAGELNVFNMHGVWDLEGDSSSPRRQQMSQVIIAETAGLSNVILAGDSNAKPSNQAMRNLEQSLKPVFGPELVTTFNMRHKEAPGYATAAVDLMYVSPDIKVIKAACPDVDVSDHLPLVVELSVGL